MLMMPGRTPGEANDDVPTEFAELRRSPAGLRSRTNSIGIYAYVAVLGASDQQLIQGCPSIR
jgi:hypothetical protein